MEEVDLKKFLEKYQDTQVDFYRFPGNYDDSLIWHGTKILLNELNISEDYIEIDSPKNTDVLFIDGGGNFVDLYIDRLLKKEVFLKYNNLLNYIMMQE